MSGIVDAFRTLSRAARSRAGGSTNRRIAAAAVTLGAITALSRGISMIRELIVAHRFGTHGGLDAFLIAYTILLFAVSVITGSFNTALIPTFIHVRESEGPDSAGRLLGNVVSITVLLLVLVVGGLSLIGPSVIRFVAAGLAPDKVDLAIRIFFQLLPIVVVSGTSALWAAVLNAGERFARVGIAQFWVPLGPAICVLAFPSWEIQALVLGTLAGSLGEAVFIASAVWRQGYSLVPRRFALDENTRTVIRQYLPLIAGAAFMSPSPIIDQAFASRLGAGSVSALQYGNRLVALLLGVSQIALGTAVLPHFSRMAAANDYRGLRHTLRTFTRLILVISVPATVFALLLSAPIVRVIYQHGAFTAADAQLVVATQQGYLLQIPMYVLGVIGVRVIVALRENRFLMWIGIINASCNCLLDFLLSRIFGVPGIALSTSGMYLLSTGLVYVAATRLLRLREAAVKDAQPASAERAMS